MTTVAACLVVGPVVAGWIAFLGGLVQSLIRYRFAEQLQLTRQSDLMSKRGLAVVNTSMQSIGTVAGGLAYQAVGGEIPLRAVSDSLSILLLVVIYMGVNHWIAALFIGLRSSARLRAHLGSLSKLIAYELPRVAVSPVLALVYSCMGEGH